MSGGTQIIRPLVLRDVDNETPSGAIDGLNTGYSTEFKFLIDSLSVFLNGLKLSQGLDNDYVITGDNTFAMNYAPITDDILIVDYRRQ